MTQPIDLIHISPVLHALICVYVYVCSLCSFVTSVGLCVHHHSQDTETTNSLPLPSVPGQ